MYHSEKSDRKADFIRKACQNGRENTDRAAKAADSVSGEQFQRSEEVF
ncbi:MAG: hypothetical protein R3275_08955 [Saprospiraceae bacterium]|nr:hypothetical protein [Saprospiraceae bacterium]